MRGEAAVSRGPRAKGAEGGGVGGRHSKQATARAGRRRGGGKAAAKIVAVA